MVGEHLRDHPTFEGRSHASSCVSLVPSTRGWPLRYASRYTDSASAGGRAGRLRRRWTILARRSLPPRGQGRRRAWIARRLRRAPLRSGPRSARFRAGDRRGGRCPPCCLARAGRSSTRPARISTEARPVRRDSRDGHRRGAELLRRHKSSSWEYSSSVSVVIVSLNPQTHATSIRPQTGWTAKWGVEHDSHRDVSLLCLCHNHPLRSFSNQLHMLWKATPAAPKGVRRLPSCASPYGIVVGQEGIACDRDQRSCDAPTTGVHGRFVFQSEVRFLVQSGLRGPWTGSLVDAWNSLQNAHSVLA